MNCCSARVRPVPRPFGQSHVVAALPDLVPPKEEPAPSFPQPSDRHCRHVFPSRKEMKPVLRMLPVVLLQLRRPVMKRTARLQIQEGTDRRDTGTCISSALPSASHGASSTMCPSGTCLVPSLCSSPIPSGHLLCPSVPYSSPPLSRLPVPSGHRWSSRPEHEYNRYDPLT